MTVEELVYSIENNLDTCYIFKGVDLVLYSDVNTSNTGIKGYFDSKVKKNSI